MQTSATPQSRLLAPWWHTAILIAVLLIASLNGNRSTHPLAAGSKIPQYLWTMMWEWILAGFVWLGIRKRIRLRELIGGRWESGRIFFSMSCMPEFSGVPHVGAGNDRQADASGPGGKIESMRRQLGFLAPETSLEFAVWFCVSVTAGFCEETIFRGYLQRQFAAIANSMLIGVLLSAVVFGASHGYEGAARMILIGIYGLMFGLLAWWRKSLRPGMMAHAWHDALRGTILRMLK